MGDTVMQSDIEALQKALKEATGKEYSASVVELFLLVKQLADKRCVDALDFANAMLDTWKIGEALYPDDINLAFKHSRSLLDARYPIKEKDI